MVLIITDQYLCLFYTEANAQNYVVDLKMTFSACCPLASPLCLKPSPPNCLHWIQMVFCYRQRRGEEDNDGAIHYKFLF